MIIDNIRSCDFYTAGNEKLKKGFDFIMEYIKNPKAPGKYTIDGDEVFAMVQEYETRLPGSAESHRKYIDIQFLAKGREMIRYADISALTPNMEFDQENDYVLYDGIEGMTELVLGEGTFAVFYPHDGHMPGIMYGDKSEPVVKIVVKVKA